MRTALALLLIAACGGSHTPTPAIANSPSVANAPPAIAPDPAPVTDGDTTDGWVHGVHVIVKRVPGAETTATQLYIVGGARTWTKQSAGLEMLAIRTAVEGGTERMPRDAFTRRLSELGSTLNGYAAQDFSVMWTWNLTPAWDETFGMLVDAFRHPALPAQQLEIARAKQLAGLRHEQEDQDARLGLAVRAGLYRGHPYENRAQGTIETVTGFSVANANAQLASMRDSSRLLLVVVGDIDPAHVMTAAQQAFGDLPRGVKPMPAVPPLAPARAGTIATIADKLPTNYLQAVAPGPRWDAPDYATAMLAMEVLNQREFQEVRTKRNLSYAPQAFFSHQSAVTLVALYVTAVDPGATLKVMYDEARRLREQPVPDAELLGAKSTLLTATYQGTESANDQATQIAFAQMHGGDWHLVRTLGDRVRAVTSAQITAWAAKHLAHLQLFVIGDDAKIDRAMVEGF